MLSFNPGSCPLRDMGGDCYPNGAYYYTGTSGTHAGEMSRPGNADCDLGLYKWSNGWRIVARSETSSSEEAISYNGTAGYYVWRVLSYSGSGDYDLCLNTP